MDAVRHFHRLVVGEMAMKRRGQVVKLENTDTGEIVEGKVIQYDSIQGYWVDWKWYRPDLWKEVKK